MIENRIVRALFHFICYYSAWFSCIIFASKGSAWGGPLVVFFITILQFFLLKNSFPKHIVIFSPLLVCSGFVIDSILLFTNYLELKSNPFAPLSSPWMIALWLNFSIIFYDCFQVYFNHFLVWAILAFLGFPFAYYIGFSFGAALFPKGYIFLLILGLIWMLLFPALCYFFRKKETYDI